MRNLHNTRLLRALAKQPVDKTPIWIMRQAGRYLPEYRKLRQSAPDFMTFCKTPELACEATLQPLQRFPLDAAIIFSDILTIPDAMGLGLEFVAGVGPRFQSPVRSERDVARLAIPDIANQLSYVTEAIGLTAQKLDNSVPLIGFSGSPWTLAAYMIEGSGSKTFSIAKRMLYADPVTLHRLLELLAQSVTQYLLAQIRAGADAVMIFDSWGGVLTTQAYQQFSLHYMQQIVSELKRHTQAPIIVFTKGGNLWLDSIAAMGCDAVGIDWTLDIAQARRQIGDRVALQGNLDPCVLYAQPEQIRQAVKALLEQYGGGPGHIFNLGHGIYPDVPPEHVAVLVDAVHEFSHAK